MGKYPPQNSKHWRRVMKKLGFLSPLRVGRGKHSNKFVHSTKKTKNWKIQPNFIIISHNIFKQNSKGIIKNLISYGFAEKEIKDAC